MKNDPCTGNCTSLKVDTASGGYRNIICSHKYLDIYFYRQTKSLLIFQDFPKSANKR